MRTVKAINLVKYNGKYYGPGSPNGYVFEMEDQEAERLLRGKKVAVPGSAEDHLAEFDRLRREEAMQKHLPIDVADKKPDKEAKEVDERLAIAEKAVKASDRRAREAERKSAEMEARLVQLEQRLAGDGNDEKGKGSKGK